MSVKNVKSLTEMSEELDKIIKELGPAALIAARPGLEAAMMFLLEAVPEYPDQPVQGGWLKQSSPGARRYFFWAVKQGLIDGWKWVDDGKGGHPEGRYKRKHSAGIGGSITYEITETKDGVQGEIGTNKKYAGWVIGYQYPGVEINGQQMWQARIHEGRWWRLPDVMEENIDKAWQEFDSGFYDELTKMFLSAE